MISDEGVKEEIDMEDLNDSIMDPVVGNMSSNNDIFGRLRPTKTALDNLKSSDEDDCTDHDVDFLVTKPEISEGTEDDGAVNFNPKVSFGGKPIEGFPEQRRSGS
eukprot:CAMPEP_0170496414 /NCGR_PEP_ID=MMETSP0208-20121228/21455_1 /TAXON_ID=197538 /ORGANISM="Strombidium inclinatum, Strain S3" /LENGTH=104 /DNA_ID=CAMNT_0010772955 /DNA_START=2614 /DNA_END=2928 /DNA_ORIENTATION=+